ncbi:MAG: phosphodiester glycosidase family protein [Actinomycetota bacterium]|nr:phosphodiester glycosidase family protein [Actinomycetota bacterium]
MALSRRANHGGLFRRALFALSLALLASSLSVATVSDVSAAKRYRKKSRQVVDGLRLIRIYDNVLGTRIKVLKIDPSSALTLDVGLSNGVLPERETTRSIAARHGALAAVNASFGLSWGRPLGVFAEDGSLKSSPIAEGGAFAIDRAETRAHIGHPELTIAVRNQRTGTKWFIKDWNDQYPNRDRIAGYTAAGGEVVPPPRYSCSVRLQPKTRMQWGRNDIGLWRRYVVAQKRCDDDRLSLRGGVVLAAATNSIGAEKIKQAKRGDTVTMGWSVGWPGVMDVLGGSPVMLNEGQIVIEPCDAYVCKRHPRTGVGITPAGDILLVTADGRQADSNGLTIVQFALFMKWLGASEALNLDGGGSTTMVLKDRIINIPSDPSGERAVASALLVLPGPDLDEPAPRPAR